MNTASSIARATAFTLLFLIGGNGLVCSENDEILTPELPGVFTRVEVHQAFLTDAGFDYTAHVAISEGPDEFSVNAILFLAADAGQHVPQGSISTLSRTYARIEDGPSIFCYARSAIFFHRNRPVQIVSIDDINRALGSPARSEVDDYLRRIVRGWGFGHSWEMVIVEPRGSSTESGSSLELPDKKPSGTEAQPGATDNPGDAQ